MRKLAVLSVMQAKLFMREPAAFFFTILVIRLLAMSVRNLRAMGRVPGYGFVALGSCGALVGLVAQTMAVQVFHHRILGFGFYALAAIVVSLDRMIREGQFEELASLEHGASSRRSPWIGS